VAGENRLGVSLARSAISAVVVAFFRGALRTTTTEPRKRLASLQGVL